MLKKERQNLAVVFKNAWCDDYYSKESKEMAISKVTTVVTFRE